MVLYHATYAALQESIREHGLCRAQIRKKSWEDCSSEYIYLCLDADCAIAFCEASDDVPEQWLNEIILIAVDAEKLDICLFALDENIINTERLTAYQYRGDIPMSVIEFVQ